eukprot:TRINITY_DN3631_c0_g1_i4.p1 TRINITY_DN3631_c0_g1~~TRINITY_DN3631_c0_g1_i4.p1  ORF type:complete len:295 (-),score=71.81 TRINITY_DN3631_c0_g1_i4:58-942(-)
MADDDCEEARSDVRLACVADVDGDLEPPRRVVRGSSVVRATVRVPPGVLCHGASFAVSQAPGDTTVAHAGLTVWPAALLLCEHLVAHHRGRLRAVLELGAGTGLCSLMASWLGASVTFATDADVKSLELCSENLAQNTHWLKSDVRVRKLDWLRHSARAFDLDHLEIEDLQLDSGNFAWRPDDVQHLREVSVVLAADVFYGIESAHVLVEKLRQLSQCSQKPTILVALERRLNFYLAPPGSEPDAPARPQMLAPAYDVFVQSALCPQRVDLTNTPHLFSELYNREPHLELWRIN